LIAQKGRAKIAERRQALVQTLPRGPRIHKRRPELPRLSKQAVTSDIALLRALAK